MFKLKLTINQDRLEALRTLPERARQNLKRELQVTLKPELQSDVDALFAIPPGPVSTPFIFGSPESRLYYLILIRDNPDLVEGDHWRRTGDIAGSFEVRISDQFRIGLISISNILSQSTGTRPYPARFVYGPFVPPGHEATGYPVQAQRAQRALQRKARARIKALWRQAIREAAKK